MPDTKFACCRDACQGILLRPVVIIAVFFLSTGFAQRSADTKPKQPSPSTATAPQQVTNAKHDGDAKLVELNRLAYILDMNSVQRAWENSNLDEVMRLLKTTSTNKERNFEWYYWHNLCYGHAQSFENPPDNIREAAFSPDRKRLVMGGDDHMAYVWDVSTGKRLFTLKGHTNIVYSVAYSSDGKLIATGSSDGLAKIWNASTGALLTTIINAGDIPFIKNVDSVSFSPDGKRVVTGGLGAAPRVWETSTGKELFAMSAGNDLMAKITHCVAFSPDDRLIVTCGESQDKLWDATTGRLLFELSGQKRLGAFPFAVFSPDSKRLLIGSAELDLPGEATLWDTATGHKLATLSGHARGVSSAVFTRDGSTVITGSWDGTVKFWNTATGKETRSITTPIASGRGCLAMSSDNSQLLVVGQKQVKTYKIDSPMNVATFHDESSGTAAFSPDGKYLAMGERTYRDVHFGAGKAETKLLEVATGRMLRKIDNRVGSVTCVLFSPDNSYLAIAGEDGKINIRDVTTGALVKSFGYGNEVTAIDFSADGERIAVGCADGYAEVFNLKTGKQVVIFKQRKEGITTVAFSPDGKLVAVSSYDKLVKILDASTGQEVRTLSDVYRFASFSHDGKSVVTGSYDRREAYLWSIATGQKLFTLYGSQEGINNASFSLDGKRIVTANDKAARIYDAQTGREILTIKHERFVTSAKFSADGTQLFTTSGSNTAQVWSSDAPSKFVH